MYLILFYKEKIVCSSVFFFFFQAEDGIRDIGVTGVQTCALPISAAAQFSGVHVRRTKFFLFLLTGLMSGFAAVCLTSRLGSTRHTIAAGWELEVVTMAVLGGVSILGGSGTIPGVVLAAIVMGLVTFGLGLLNVPGIVMSIFIGLLLILVIALPIVIRRIRSRAAA